MFAPVSTVEVATSEKPVAYPAKVPIIPVSDDAPPCIFRHPTHGEPVAQWSWRDANGALVGWTMRFDFEKDGKAHKEVLPVTFCEIKEGDRIYRAWRSCGVPAPRPLYRLPQLLASPDKLVIFTEGEKKADRAVELFPDFESTTTMAGASQPHLIDFAALAGRRVIIWPDHDDAGHRYARRAALLALEAGASKAAIVQVPDSFPSKWDLADEPPAGVTVDDLRRLLGEAVLFRTDDEEPSVEPRHGYGFTRRGLVWKDPTDEVKPEVLLAGKFDVLAETRDADGFSWGVLLQWQDHDGRLLEKPFASS